MFPKPVNLSRCCKKMISFVANILLIRDRQLFRSCSGLCLLILGEYGSENKTSNAMWTWCVISDYTCSCVPVHSHIETETNFHTSCAKESSCAKHVLSLVWCRAVIEGLLVMPVTAEDWALDVTGELTLCWYISPTNNKVVTSVKKRYILCPLN